MAILTEYSNYNDVFSTKYVANLLEYIKINNYAIKLKKDKQPLFGPIYSLDLVMLEILKLTLRLTWLMALFGLLSPQLEHLFFLIGN